MNCSNRKRGTSETESGDGRRIGRYLDAVSDDVRWGDGEDARTLRGRSDVLATWGRVEPSRNSPLVPRASSADLIFKFRASTHEQVESTKSSPSILTVQPRRPRAWPKSLGSSSVVTGQSLRKILSRHHDRDSVKSMAAAIFQTEDIRFC